LNFALTVCPNFVDNVDNFVAPIESDPMDSDVTDHVTDVTDVRVTSEPDSEVLGQRRPNGGYGAEPLAHSAPLLNQC